MALIELAIPAIVTVAVSLLVWSVYGLLTRQSVVVRDRISRYGAAGSPVPTGATGALGQAADAATLLKDRALSRIRALDDLLRHSEFANRVALDLARAAVPLRVGEYLLLRWLAATCLFLIPYTLRMPWFLDVLLGLVGLYAPALWVRQREQARIRQIEDQLVDCLTMMANALRAGASFLQAMELASRELPPPLSQELGQVVAEISVGSPVNQSLEALNSRIRSYDVYLITTAIGIQRTVGGNLSEILDSIARTIRERQRLLRQVQVETAEQRTSAYVLLALPTLMLFLMSFVNRSYVDSMLQSDAGRLMLGAALGLQVLGYLLIRRIADVKV